MLDRIKILIFLLIIPVIVDCNRKPDNSVRKQLFDLNWKFTLENNQLAYQVDFNDRSWRNIDLPHDWSLDADLLKLSSENPGDSISCWYRKHFIIPENWNSKNIQIDFEGLNDNYKIYVNGIPVDGAVEGGTSFQTHLNPYLNSNGKNVIAVRVTIPYQSNKTKQNEIGIYKHVWLVIS